MDENEQQTIEPAVLASKMVAAAVAGSTEQQAKSMTALSTAEQPKGNERTSRMKQNNERLTRDLERTEEALTLAQQQIELLREDKKRSEKRIKELEEQVKELEEGQFNHAEHFIRETGIENTGTSQLMTRNRDYDETSLQEEIWRRNPEERNTESQRGRQSPTNDAHRRMPAGRSQSRESGESEKSRKSNNSNRSSYKAYQMDVLASQALPGVQKFSSAKGAKQFDEFLEQQDMKYLDILSDAKMVTVLKSHLVGDAKRVFESVTRNRELSYAAIVKQMRARMKGDATLSEYESTGSWERLTMARDADLTSFTLDLEELTYRAHPDFPEKCLSSMMAKKLIAQLSHWREYEELIKVMEEARKGEKYEKVKEAALRMEMLEKRGEKLGVRGIQSHGRSSREQYRVENKQSAEHRGYGRVPYQKHSHRGGFTSGNRPEEQKRMASDAENWRTEQPSRQVQDVQSARQDEQRQTVATGGNAQQLNGPPQNLNSRSQGNNFVSKPPPKCYNCQQIGHFAAYCKNRTQNRIQRANEEENSLIPEKEEEEELFWKPLSSVTVLMNGVEVKAIVDSGSEVTTVPEDVMKRIEAAGAVEWRDMVKGEVLDAAASRIEILGKALVTIECESEKKLIGVYVVKKGVKALLGRNAEKLWERKVGVWKENEHQGEPAFVMKEVYIPPRARTEVMLMKPTDKQMNMLVEVKGGACEGIVTGTGETRKVQIHNVSEYPLRLKKNEKVGEWRKANWMALGDGDSVEKENSSSQEEGEVVEQRVESQQSSERAKLVLEQISKNGEIKSDECKKVVDAMHFVFALCDEEMGRTTLVEHYVDTGEASPIKQKQHPVPLGIQDKVREQLEGMKKRGVIRDSSSPWSSPLVIALKKDSSLRLCVDYRKLNGKVKNDAYPLPSIDMTLLDLEKKRVFSTLDLISGYWQIPLEESSKEKTAFSTMGGHYEWNVLPFGLSTSPATFQRVMEKVLEEVLSSRVHVYIDDILIATETEEEHARELEKVLEALNKHGLRLKSQKCKIAQSSVEYLGHRITREGVLTDEAKVEKIRDQPAPRDRKEMKRFLGMCSYYRKFIHRFAEKALPLTKLTSEKTEWKWTESEEKPFQEMKNLLMSSPILAQPNIEAAKTGEKPFIVYTDASREAVGAVLCQEGEDGCLHPLYFASKKSSPAEKNYHVTDSEALAIVFALRKFRPFYFGTKIVVRTDHQPLKALFGQKSTSARILRWALEIQYANVVIEYVKGSANKVADALSRSPVRVEEQPESEQVEVERVVNHLSRTEGEANAKCVSSRVVRKVTLIGVREKWRAETEKDEKGAEMLARVRESREKAVREKGFRWTEEGGILRVEGASGGKRIFVPESLRMETLSQWHDGKLGGHWGTEKMLKKMKEYYWERMRADVDHYVKSCRICGEVNNAEKMTPPLQCILAKEPFEIVGIDILEIGTSVNGNRYLLTIIDAFTKYGSAIPLESKSAKEVAAKFMSCWVAEGRLPETLLSDQGGEFANRVLKELLTMLNVKHITTKGYNPRENGLVERFNQTIIKLLQKKVKEPERWDESMPFVLYAYNTAPHSSTGESPFFLLHGRDPRPLGENLRLEEQNKYQETEEYKKDLVNNLRIAHESARENLEKAAQSMKKQYDERNRVENKNYPKIGDRVMVKVPAEKRAAAIPKLVTEWQGPFRVLEVSANSAKVKNMSKNEVLILPFDQLKKVREEVEEEKIQERKERKRMQRGINILFRSEHPLEWEGHVSWIVPVEWKKGLEKRTQDTVIGYEKGEDLLEILKSVHYIKSRVTVMGVTWKVDEEWIRLAGSIQDHMRRVDSLAEKIEGEVVVMPDLPPDDVTLAEKEQMAKLLGGVFKPGRRVTVATLETCSEGSAYPVYLLQGPVKRGEKQAEWKLLKHVKNVSKASGLDVDYLKTKHVGEKSSFPRGGIRTPFRGAPRERTCQQQQPWRGSSMPSSYSRGGRGSGFGGQIRRGMNPIHHNKHIGHINHRRGLY